MELLLRFIEAFNRGDLEGALALADAPPEFEFVPSCSSSPTLRAFQRGPEGLRRGVDVSVLTFPRVHAARSQDRRDVKRSPTEPPPSKLPDCRTRRCRRRTPVPRPKQSDQQHG